MLPLFAIFHDPHGLKTRSKACRISNSHASIQWLPQAAQPFVLGIKSYGSFQRAPVALVRGGLVSGGALGPTPEAQLTMDVAFGPGDPVRAVPTRASGASLASAASDTFRNVRV